MRPIFHPHFLALRRSKLPVYQKFLAKEATLYCMVACHVVGLQRDSDIRQETLDSRKQIDAADLSLKSFI